jgi:hypothetical protein
MATELAEGAACVPNMSAGARAVRTRVARAAAIAALGALVVAVVLGAPWWARWLVTMVPALVATASYFEARSNVCVLRAAEGTFEHDDRSRTTMEASVLPAIRRAATSVIAKALVAGVAASGLGALLSMVA